MYCKQCGSQIEENAKFCQSCGAPVEQQEPEQQYTAPEPYVQNSVDESQNYQYQQSTFRGKQYSTGTSGSIGFGNPNKRSGFSKLIRFGVIAVVVIIGFFIIGSLFGGGPITYIESGTGIDLTISELTGKTDTFTPTTPQIYILFDYEELEVGDRLYLSLFYEDETYSMDSYYFDLEDTEGWAYVYLTPVGTWDVGTYYVEFVVGDELLETYEFTVE